MGLGLSGDIYVTLVTCQTTYPTANTRNTFHIQAEEDNLSGLSEGHSNHNATSIWVKYMHTMDLIVSQDDIIIITKQKKSA
jgi:hypothetical protein